MQMQQMMMTTAMARGMEGGWFLALYPTFPPTGWARLRLQLLVHCLTASSPSDSLGYEGATPSELPLPRLPRHRHRHVHVHVHVDPNHIRMIARSCA